jgi:ribosomal protein L11 methyltransferase
LLAEGLGDLAAPGGKLILSGILEDQVPEIESGIEAAGLMLLQKHQLGDWIALVAE